MDRPSKETVLMETALLYATRSTCARIKAGAVIALGGHIISVGYNGNASGKVHCDDHFYDYYLKNVVESKKFGNFEDYTLSEDFKVIHKEWSNVHELHAEMNAIIWAARRGIAVENSDIYTTYSPCLFCTKAILQAGIKRVFYNKIYDRPEGLESLKVLKENGIFVEQIRS